MVSTLTCSAAFSACTSPRQTEEKRKEREKGRRGGEGREGREEGRRRREGRKGGGEKCWKRKEQRKKGRIREGAQVREPYHYTTVL